jgi:phospholipid transport system substrate-binding protein
MVRNNISVRSKLIPQDEEIVEFNYQLRNIENRMRIVDIKISGVSQLAVTRSQFVDVIEKTGFDGLIALLKDKIELFSTGKK